MIAQHGRSPEWKVGIFFPCADIPAAVLDSMQFTSSFLAHDLDGAPPLAISIAALLPCPLAHMICGMFSPFKSILASAAIPGQMHSRPLASAGTESSIATRKISGEDGILLPSKSGTLTRRGCICRFHLPVLIKTNPLFELLHGPKPSVNDHALMY